MCRFSAKIGECFWLPIDGQSPHPAIVIGEGEGEVLVVHVSDAEHGLDPTSALDVGEIECIIKPSQIICAAAHLLDPNSLISDVRRRNAWIASAATDEVVKKLRWAVLSSPRSRRGVQKWLRKHYSI